MHNQFSLDFRIEMGYVYTYSRRHYHPVYIWDGNLSVSNGEICKTFLINHTETLSGLTKSPTITPLEKPEWQFSTKRKVMGVQIIAKVNENSVFNLNTASFDCTFTAKDVLEKGRLVFNVGPEYQGCLVTVNKTGYQWFAPQPQKGQTILRADNLGIEVHEWARHRLAFLKPREQVSFEYQVKKPNKDFFQTLINITAMATPVYCQRETPVVGKIPFELYCDGKLVHTFYRHYRFHDIDAQLLEDLWERVCLPEGKHTLTLKNLNDDICCGIEKISLSEQGYDHGQLSLPPWCIKGQEEKGKVFSIENCELTIDIESKKIKIQAEKGWNEFSFIADGENQMRFSVLNNTAVTEIIQQHGGLPTNVGYDMTTVPHDDSGYMDWLLDYTYRTKLGNYVLFRNFLNIYDPKTGPLTDEQIKRWATFCREHKIWVSTCLEYENPTWEKFAGEYFHDSGRHEYPGAVYARNPAEPWSSSNMKEAMENYIKYLRLEIAPTKKASSKVAFGDAATGTRYTYLAGVDYVRAETMVGHTQLLLSNVRPTTQALGDGKWGVHIAIQHHYKLKTPLHLNKYFLSLMQPWMMGAETIYEEDTLFSLLAEERQCWDSALTKGKRDMTRNFFKFVNKVGRYGKNIRNIAFLEGRYAAPFNGFICDGEQDPHYSVWGLFGNKDSKAWGHCQPEKCRQILDVLNPGASTHPLRQKYDKRRYYFSGTPYGDYDCVPIESSADYLKDNYKLIANLGWNTLIEEDYQKLKTFVENGGILLTGIPQFSTHIEREFLLDMQDLALYNNGDLSDLTGIKVLGKGVEYSRQWNSKNREKICESELSAICSDNELEDGTPYLAEVELKGAQIIAWDKASGKPMLVKYKLGKGWVYTLTLWDYPGHEQFQTFSATWLEVLAKDARGKIYIEDQSKQVFWTTWVNGNTTEIMMLNTDYFTPGNQKTVNLVINEKSYPIDVKESVAYSIKITDDKFKIDEYTI